MTVPGHGRGAMRASDEDRRRVEVILNDAYAEGRLTQAEWDERTTALTSAKTYADLDELVVDLPAGQPYPQVAVPPPPVPALAPTSGIAVAALICAVGQLVAGPPAGIAAVVLGHMARRRIRMTREQGDGLAVAGLVLGYLGIIGFILVVIVASVAIASLHPQPGFPPSGFPPSF